MNYEEIIKKFEELGINPRMVGYGDYESDEQYDFIKSLGQCKEVEHIGGGEGGGEDVERVFFFTDHNIYIRIIGFYCSGEGTDWDSEFTQVFPRKVIKTVYESAEERGDKTDEA